MSPDYCKPKELLFTLKIRRKTKLTDNSKKAFHITKVYIEQMYPFASVCQVNNFRHKPSL